MCLCLTSDSNNDISQQSQLRPEEGWRSPSNPNTPTSPTSTTTTTTTTSTTTNEPLCNKLSLDSNKTYNSATNNLNKVNCSRTSSIADTSLADSDVTNPTDDSLCNGGHVEKQWVDVVTG